MLRKILLATALSVSTALAQAPTQAPIPEPKPAPQVVKFINIWEMEPGDEAQGTIAIFGFVCRTKVDIAKIVMAANSEDLNSMSEVCSFADGDLANGTIKLVGSFDGTDSPFYRNDFEFRIYEIVLTDGSVHVMTGRPKAPGA